MFSITAGRPFYPTRLTRVKLARSGLFVELASESGSTPWQYAVCRGDLEIVELLLEHGAEISTKNDLGRDVMSYVVSIVISITR